MKPTPIAPDYTAFLAEVKSRIQTARLQAGRAVNRELVMLYWDIGRGIVEKQQVAGWGDAVVERFAADLRAEFPDMQGFSPANVWRMRQCFEVYSDPEFLAQAVRELGPVPVGMPRDQFLAQAVRELVAAVPCGHHVFLLGKIKEPKGMFYYLRATAQFGWSRSVLLNQIKGQAYERAVKEKKTHNFELALPEHFAEQANEMLNCMIILCAEKDDVEVEFALKTKANPIGVAEYQLQGSLPAEFKGKLPTAKQLADVAREFLPAPKAPARKKRS